MLLVLASFIIFIILLTHTMKKHEKAQNNALNEFWEKERQSNQTRKKSLDNLDYVEIPFPYIPKSLLAENASVQDCLEILESLSGKKIVNLTGYSNTDLKLQYGTANLPVLSEYDENYTLYARTLYKLARIYYDNGYESNAVILLEKGIESGTDITGNYTLLAQIYRQKGAYEKIENLINSAASLRSMTRKNIIRSLEEYAREY